MRLILLDAAQYLSREDFRLAELQIVEDTKGTNSSEKNDGHRYLLFSNHHNQYLGPRPEQDQKLVQNHNSIEEDFRWCWGRNMKPCLVH